MTNTTGIPHRIAAHDYAQHRDTTARTWHTARTRDMADRQRARREASDYVADARAAREAARAARIAYYSTPEANEPPRRTR